MDVTEIATDCDNVCDTVVTIARGWFAGEFCIFKEESGFLCAFLFSCVSVCYVFSVTFL